MSLSLIWMTSLYPLTLGLQFLHSYIHIKLKYSEHFFQQDIKNYCFTEITINWTKPFFFFIAPLDFFSTTFYWAVCFFLCLIFSTWEPPEEKSCFFSDCPASHWRATSVRSRLYIPLQPLFTHQKWLIHHLAHHTCKLIQ